MLQVLTELCLCMQKLNNMNMWENFHMHECVIFKKFDDWKTLGIEKFDQGSTAIHCHVVLQLTPIKITVSYRKWLTLHWQ